MLAHSPAITAQSTADDLASLLCSLLCYTLTSLLCTSCSLLRSGTLEQPFLLGKLSASGSVIEYHFGIACDAARSLPPTTCALISSNGKANGESAATRDTCRGR